jgi:hypothetical protein
MAERPDEGVDPGWKPALARFARAYVHRKTPGVADPLTEMRQIFLGLEMAFFLFLIPLSFLARWDDGDAGIAPWLVIGAGVLSLLGISWVRRRPLNMATESGLAAQFRTALFLGFGIAEIPGLLGVAAAIITKSLWIYLIGLAFSLVDLTLIGPTRAEIARRQRQIAEAHLPHDLTRSLLSRPDQRLRSDER